MVLKNDMIFYRLRQHFPAAAAHFSHELSAGRPIFPDTEEKNSQHVVVIGPDSWEHFVAHHSDPLIVYVGISERLLFGRPENYIALPETCTVDKVFNVLTETFDLFEKWQAELKDAVEEYFSYNAILDSCELFMHEPIALVDTQFKYISYTRRLASQAGYDKYVQNSIYLPLEEINYLNSLPDFKALEKRTDVFQYVAVENLLHKNIFHDGKYIARLSIPYAPDESTNYFYRCILEILASCIERLYDRFGTFTRLKKEDSLFKEYMIQLLSGKSVQDGELSRILKKMNYHEKDQYYLIMFTAGFTNNNEDTSRALASRLEMLVPGARCLQFENHTLALVNNTYYESREKTSFMQQLAYYLRDSLLQAGISRAFTDLHALSAALHQCEIALHMGVLRDSSSWYFKFDHYAFPYLMQHGYQGFLPEQICHPAVIQLLQYDREHETQLYDTLKTYIQQQYNASECARKLYINRSSLLKRLERIEQLTGIRLPDVSDRTYIALSYLIMEENQWPGEDGAWK